MVDEQQPAKKVVKRVVKKTVVRPASPPTQPTVRYGRPVATPTRPSATSAATPKPRAKAASRPAARPGTTRTRPRVNVGAAGKALTSRSAGIASGVGGAARSAGRATGTFAADRFHAAMAWRVPHLEPRLAATITGLVVGLVSVGLGRLALGIFSDVRGVASGGGRWGFLTFVVIAVVAVLLGRVLLTAFGVARGGLIGFLAVVLSIVAILGVFLDLAGDQRAVVLLPVLGIVTFLVSHWLIDLAESSPTLPE